MANTLLCLIPNDPAYVPSQEATDKAVVVLMSLGLGSQPHVITYDNIEFIDQGGNFEGIACPCCSTAVDLAWWGEAMSGAYDASHFHERTVQMPCCGCTADLNDLRYSWPAGFARFCIRLSDPSRNLSEDEMDRISQALGITIRQVWARY